MLRKAILLALVFACLPSFVLADIGRIKRTVGTAFVERGAQQIEAKSGMILQRKDVLVTGTDGRITVTFIDNSRFSTGPDSRVNLIEFRFNETTLEGQFEVEIEQGTTAIISGQIAAQDKDAMRVKTPTSVLGVRGTRFIVQVQPALVLLPDETPEGTDGADAQPAAKKSSVAINDADGNTKAVVEDPYAIARIGNGGHFSSATDPESVDAEHGTLLKFVPPPPKKYVIEFENGSSNELSESGKAALVELLEDFKSRPGADVLITGHTDTVGSRADNDRLSIRRALHVFNELQKLGLERSAARLAGRGERELLVETENNVSEAKNRRAEVIVR